MIDNAIKSLVATASGIAAVGPVTAFVGPTAVPRVTYTALGGPREYTNDGAVGIVETLFQLDAYAATATAARALLANVMRKSTASGLDGYAGTVDSTKIERISFDETPQMGPAPVPAREGSNQTTARYLVTMRVHHRE